MICEETALVACPHGVFISSLTTHVQGLFFVDPDENFVKHCIVEIYFRGDSERMRPKRSKPLTSRPSKKKLDEPVVEKEDQEPPCSRRTSPQARNSNVSEKVASRRTNQNGMEGQMVKNQNRLSHLETELAELKSVQKDMEKKFDAMVEQEKQWRIDGFKLSDLKIIGLQHQIEDCHKKMQESVKNLYYGEKYLLRAIEDLADLGAPPRSPMQRNVKDSNVSAPTRAAQTGRLKCEFCRQTFSNRTRYDRHQTICSRNEERRAKVSQNFS